MDRFDLLTIIVCTATLLLALVSARRAEGKRRYFWHIPGDLLRKQRGGRDVLLPDSPSLTWRGPIYWNRRAWHNDVLTISEFVRSLIASNAPFVGGMDAAAREERRHQLQWTPRRLMRMVAGVEILSIVIDQDGLTGPEAGVRLLGLVGITFVFLGSRFFSNKRRLKVFLALKSRLEAGASISDAMASLPRFFPRYLVDLVRVGEETGDMEAPFLHFNGDTLRSLDLHRHLQWVLRYLVLVVAIQLSLISFIGLKVLPVFLEINSEVHSSDTAYTPPPQVAKALALQGFVTTHGHHWPKVAVIGGLIVACYVLRRFRKRRGWASSYSSGLLFALPWFRGIVVRQNLGMIAFMLHGLLRGGVTLDAALGMCCSADIHSAYRNWLTDLRRSLNEGASLREALAATRRSGLIPDSFVGQLEAGEYGGQLPEALHRIASLYQREASRRTGVLAAMVLPIGILALGYVTLYVQTLVFQLLVGLSDSMIV